METIFEELDRKLKEGIVRFTFVANNGNVRTVWGTKTPIHRNLRKGDEPGRKFYYDMDREAWCCFTPGNLISIDGYMPWFGNSLVELKPVSVRKVGKRELNGIGRIFEKTKSVVKGWFGYGKTPKNSENLTRFQEEKHTSSATA